MTNENRRLGSADQETKERVASKGGKTHPMRKEDYKPLMNRPEKRSQQKAERARK